MAKKKSPPQEKEEKPKPIERTPIIVALIGMTGTIIVTLITVFANRSATPTPQEPVAISSEASDTSLEVETSAPVTSPPTSDSCLDDYFAEVSQPNRFDMATGISLRVLPQNGNLFGLRLFENGQLLGEMKILGQESTKSFQVTSMIDAACIPVTDFENLDRPIAQGAVGDWENLGITFSTGTYRLRMGWYGSSEVELIFSPNP